MRLKPLTVGSLAPQTFCGHPARKSTEMQRSMPDTPQPQACHNHPQNCKGLFLTSLSPFLAKGTHRTAENHPRLPSVLVWQRTIADILSPGWAIYRPGLHSSLLHPSMGPRLSQSNLGLDKFPSEPGGKHPSCVQHPLAGLTLPFQPYGTPGDAPVPPCSGQGVGLHRVVFPFL